MAKPVPEGDRLLSPAEKLSVVAEANYQIEPLLYAMRLLAEQESDHLRFYCIAVLPRLQQLNHAAQNASCDECYLSELAGYDVPVVG